MSTVKLPHCISNPISYLFNGFETYSGIPFTVFTTSQVPDNTFHKQVNLTKYQQKNDGAQYKYLYDPGLKFDWRFHQRIASIKYDQRKEPWVTLMFNIGIKNPLTNMISHNFTTYEQFSTGIFEVGIKRESIPVNFVFISNDITYLNSYLGKIQRRWDRFVNFPYQQTIQYTNSLVKTYSLTGQAMNIVPEDLEKLDTEMRGSLVTAAYTFNMIYYEYTLPERGNVLEEIDLKIKVVDDITLLHLAHEFDLVINEDS